MKHLGLVGLGAVVLAMPAAADPEGTFGQMHPHMGGYGYEGYGMILGPLFMLVLLAALVVGVIVLVRFLMPGAGGTGTGTGGGGSALEALNMRLAKGEIEPEDYEARRKLLAD